MIAVEGNRKRKILQPSLSCNPLFCCAAQDCLCPLRCLYLNFYGFRKIHPLLQLHIFQLFFDGFHPAFLYFCPNSQTAYNHHLNQNQPHPNHDLNTACPHFFIILLFSPKNLHSLSFSGRKNPSEFSLQQDQSLSCPILPHGILTGLF